MAVDLGLVRRVGVAKGRGDIAEGRHQACDFRSAHPTWAVARVRVKLCFGAGAFGLGLSDPPGDYRRVGAGIEGGSLAFQLRVAFVDDRLGCRGRSGRKI